MPTISPPSFTGGGSFGEPSVVSDSYVYEGSGGLTLGGSASADYDVVVVLTASYNILAALEVSADFQYNIGDLPLYWFRAEGVCKQQNSPGCAAGGPTDQSGMLPIPNMNDRPIDGSCPQMFVQILTATTPAKVCETLKNVGFVWKLNRLSRFSIPANPAVARQMALEGTIDPNCNSLTDMPFCQLPECQEFCLDDDAVSHMGMTMRVIDTFYEYEGLGGVQIGGSSAAEATPGLGMAARASLPEAGGGIKMGGGALVRCSHHRVVRPVQGVHLLLSGSALVKSSHSRYFGGGEVMAGGHAKVISSHYKTRGGGRLALGGGAAARRKRHYRSSGFGWNPPHYTTFKLAGQANATQGPLTGRSFVSAQAVYDITPSSVASGEAVGDWLLKLKLTPPGISGGSFGTPTLEIPDFYVSSWGAAASTSGLTASFRGIPAGTMTPSSAVISNECGCDALPMSMQISHELGRSEVFRNFLTRNGLTMPTVVDVVYNSLNRSYQSNTHLSGLANDGGRERWSVLFEWACTSVIGGTNVGSPVWKFSMQVSRRNTSFAESRLVVGFPPSSLCAQANKTGLDFSFDFDTRSGAVLTEEDLAVEIAVFHDGLDVFASESWNKDPLFSVHISGVVVEPAIPRQDISPIFP